MFFTPIWFAYTSVDCVVAEGKAIYVEVYGDFCASAFPPAHFGRNEEELQACVDALPPKPPEWVSAVNGQQVADLDAYRVTTPMFNVNDPPDTTATSSPRRRQANT